MSRLRPKLRVLAAAVAGGAAAGIAAWLIHDPDPARAGVLIFAGILIGSMLRDR